MFPKACIDSFCKCETPGCCCLLGSHMRFAETHTTHETRTHLPVAHALHGVNQVCKCLWEVGFELQRADVGCDCLVMSSRVFVCGCDVGVYLGVQWLEHSHVLVARDSLHCPALKLQDASQVGVRDRKALRLRRCCCGLHQCLWLSSYVADRPRRKLVLLHKTTY